MKKLLLALAVMMPCAGWSLAGITENVDNTLWSFGANVPELQTGARGDGSSGAYHHLPVGTNIYYYTTGLGEGSVVFWIYDPYNCTAKPAPAGMGVQGPGWGLINASSAYATVGINRSSWVGGCTGYNPWSSVAPFSPGWFKDGIRGSHGLPFQAGWYKWSVTGTYENIAWTIFNVNYYVQDGCDSVSGVCNGGQPPVLGNCTQIYDAGAGTFNGGWASLFGSGFQGFLLNGDDPTGPEDISCDVVAGTGVFAAFGDSVLENRGVGIRKTFHQTTWGNIKALYR